jgi:tetratricopeptide (TPR) repeat protein
LYTHASLAFVVDDFATAQPVLDDFVAFAHASDGAKMLTVGYRLQADLARSRGDPDRARELIEKALAIERRIGNRSGIRHCLHLLGEMARDEGNLGSAEELLEEAAAAAREHGASDLPALTHSLADLALDQGNWSRATKLYLEFLDMADELGNVGALAGAAWCFAGLAGVAAGRGDAARAGRLWGATLNIEQDVGYGLPAFERDHYERLLDCVRGPVFAQAVTEGRDLSIVEARAMAREPATVAE